MASGHVSENDLLTKVFIIYFLINLDFQKLTENCLVAVVTCGKTIHGSFLKKITRNFKRVKANWCLVSNMGR